MQFMIACISSNPETPGGFEQAGFCNLNLGYELSWDTGQLLLVDRTYPVQSLWLR